MTEAMHLILIFEDDKAMQNILRMFFEANGFRVLLADTAVRGERDTRLHRPDLVLVDLGLPDRDGIHVISAIRAWSPVPIVVLTAQTAEAQRLAAFELGADDYVMKPFSAPELLARVRAVLRRHVRGDLPMGMLELGDVLVDMTRRVARRRDGSDVRLTPLEYRLLETLARHGDRLVTHSVLEADPSRPRYIRTELGLGYRLVVQAESVDERDTQRAP